MSLTVAHQPIILGSLFIFASSAAYPDIFERNVPEARNEERRLFLQAKLFFARGIRPHFFLSFVFTVYSLKRIKTRNSLFFGKVSLVELN